ncbi:hypothetical protein BX666DRAFT_1959713 [Dichotomocladium elegans]|nr:hypothetical protein BX666DRAFT_1959713 [Dichotomocladium elegans]
MASGQLSVTPVTARGLEDAGLGGARTFIGCYIDPSQKHRTRSANGPEPEWNHTLYCNVCPGNSYLQVELVNEDPECPGVVGGARVALFQVFNEGRVEQWVTIVGHQNEPVAQLLLHLEFKGEFAAGDEEEQHSRGVEQEQEEEDGVPTWVKFGGAALGAAAVVGLGVWAYHEYKEDQEEEERKKEEEAGEHNYYGEGHRHEDEDEDGSSSSSSSSSSSDEE